MLSHEENAILMLAYAKGRKAYEERKDRSECGYSFGTIEYEHWNQGYDDGEREFRLTNEFGH